MQVNIVIRIRILQRSLVQFSQHTHCIKMEKPSLTHCTFKIRFIELTFPSSIKIQLYGCSLVIAVRARLSLVRARNNEPRLTPSPQQQTNHVLVNLSRHRDVPKRIYYRGVWVVLAQRIRKESSFFSGPVTQRGGAKGLATKKKK